MKIESVILLFVVIFFVACDSQKKATRIDVERQVEKLLTIEDKRKFLEKIFRDDQSVRDTEKSAALVLKYGLDSEEAMEYTRKMVDQDEKNLIKVKSYLDKFGYPSITNLGKEASTAPYIVIHHTPDVYVRNSFFKKLYKAYLNNHIDDTQLAFYLGRTYKSINREDFYIQSPFKSEDEINGLIEALGLEKEKQSVIKNIAN